MAQQQMIRVYTGKKRQREFQHDAAQLAREGYLVAGQTDVREAPGCLGRLMFGFFAGSKYKLTVTYQKNS